MKKLKNDQTRREKTEKRRNKGNKKSIKELFERIKTYLPAKTAEKFALKTDLEMYQGTLSARCDSLERAERSINKRLNTLNAEVQEIPSKMDEKIGIIDQKTEETIGKINQKIKEIDQKAEETTVLIEGKFKEFDESLDKRLDPFEKTRRSAIVWRVALAAAVAVILLLNIFQITHIL